jgi:hypothetical protein
VTDLQSPVAPANPLLIEKDAADNAQRQPLPENYFLWNDRHLGADIYVVGASPQLIRLSEKQVRSLADAIVIGGNNTYYRIPLTYMLSAYQLEICKAAMHLPPESLIHMRLPGEAPVRPDVNVLNRAKFSPAVGLPRYMTAPVPTLYTHRNQVLAMTHLAIIMGARRIVYVGVEQTNYAYFWQYNDTLRTALRRDIHKLQTQRYSDASDPVKRQRYFESMHALLEQPVEEREKMPFLEDLTDVFRCYFDYAKSFGVEIVATIEGSVIHNAGAVYRPLDQ